jgi:hypothetical protein
VSFDLAFWYENKRSDSAQAAKIYDKLSDEHEGVTERNPAVSAFSEAVLSQFADLTWGSDHIQEARHIEDALLRPH